MGRKINYKYCIVPCCTSSTSKSSGKIFFNVPKNPVKRRAWTTAMKRDEKLNPKLSNTSSLWCCEDHFTLSEDMANYWQWKLTNASRLQLKSGVIPHIFDCQRKHVERSSAKRRRKLLSVQKELEAQREAGLINDDVPEVPNLERISSSVQQASSVINDPAQRTPQDSNTTELVTSEFQNINSSQLSSMSALPVAECAVESSSTSQTTLNNDPFTLPLVTNTDTYTSSSISQNMKPSEITVISAVGQDQYTFPVVKSTVVNSSATKVPTNKESFTQSVTYSTKNSSSTVPQNINSSKVAPSSATVKDSCALPVTKKSVKSISKTVSHDPFTLPLVSSAETYTLPGLSLPVVSSSVQGYNTRRIITVKKTVPTPQISCTRRSIATQINVDELNFPRTGKKIMYPSKKRSTAPYSSSTKPSIKPVTIKGRRIIDFGFFFKKLKWANKHSKFGCNLNNMFITKERKIGICTSYVLKCVVCDFQTVIYSEILKRKNNLNSDFVSGMSSINCSFHAMNKLLTTMCLPNLTVADFVKERNKISSGKDDEKECENSSENIKLKTQSVVQQNLSSTLDSSSLLEQIELGGLLVEDQFEIKEENTAESESESEDILHDQTMRAFNDEMIDQEQAILNTAIVKQEIDSDLDDEELTCFITNEIETSNKESFIKNNSQTKVVSSQLKEVRAFENKNANKEEVAFDTTIIKKEIDSDFDNEELPNSIINKIQMPNKDCLTENDKQSKVMLSQQRGVSASESKMVINQEQINLHKNVMIQHSLANDKLVESEFKDTEIADKESIANLAKSKFNNEEISTSKKIKLSHEEKFGSITTNPQTSFAVNETAKLIYSANQQQTLTAVPSRFALNVTATSSAMTSTENVTASSSITGGMGNVYLIPMQPMTTSNRNDAFIAPQVSHNVASGSFQGVQSATLIPQTSTVVQQNTGQSNNGLSPLTGMHQSWTNDFTPTISNPFILIPGVSEAAAYMSGPPAKIQGSANSSNVAVNASGITYVPLVPAAGEQASNSSNNRSPLNVRPPDVPRWVGRANMNDNNPFCTLPGGAPKGVSDPVSPKSNNDQTKNQSKRPRFRCDDCDINFPKYESLDSHKKSYCVKRLKLPPSSTATSHTLVNNLSQPTCLTSSFKTYVEELLSAMAIKRSFLETSMKTALDAQYIINLHKSAQDLTQKTFKELDNALKREKALAPEASLEEQQIVSAARNQALIRAEAAYKQEKYSAAAVEQALYRQKAAIEASLTATGHEQTALVSTLRSLKEQVNQDGMSSMLQTRYNNICDLTTFNQKKLLDNSLAQTTEHQNIANSTSSESVFDHKASSSKSSFFMEQRSGVGATSHANILQNVMHFDVHSEKLNTFNLEENKAIILNILPSDSSQPKEIEETSNAATFQNYQKSLSPDYFHPQKVLNSNIATSSETSSTEYKNESISHECFHPQEVRDARVLSGNTQASVHYADKFCDQAEEMMDISAASSSENIQTLMYDIQQSSVPHNFSSEKRKLGNSPETLATEDSQSPVSLCMTQSKPSCTGYC